MRASLDTNVIIHTYRAGLQDILFNFFDEGVFIYEQIRNIELDFQKPGKKIYQTFFERSIPQGRFEVDERVSNSKWNIA